MSQVLAISITLCYQFSSKYYNTRALKQCILSASQLAENMLDNVNIVFEDIEEATHSNQIHENTIASIRKSHIVVFEISDLNPNVIYELGIASALKKPIIVIRESSSTEELPSDINQFIYIEYNSENMDGLESRLAKKIKKAYGSYNEIDFISDKLKEKVVDFYLQNEDAKVFEKLHQYKLFEVLKNKQDFQLSFEKLVSGTKTNFYYVGTMGFLSSGDQWLKTYTDNFDKNKVFSRIVYLQTLSDFYAIYQDEEMLVDYCVWLAKNYYLLKNKIITISFSEDAGIWKNGISFIVSDEESLMISTGSFTDMYNGKGFVIRNKNIASMFKEYAKILAIKSKEIKPRKFAKYFSLSEETNLIPEEINNILNSDDLSDLQEACSNYIELCLDKMGY